ncbi:hypothetical protein BLX24_12735 [Arsenicibacter rosenii]|uniref:Phosphoglyceromutase n=2 Tax=Arsenicibacter rosenii TaxID=1750698 RepID=A0A1S2VLN2_9BACT|nr:hypothetical protein BLX24_12735 [Arsenicibacter rosenii]
MKSSILLWFLLLFSVVCAQPALAQPAQNIVLITLDGVRWQEVFTGADSTLLFDPVFSPDTAKARKTFWAPTAAERRQKLLPFWWNVVAKQGQLYGNRLKDSKVNTANPYWFSYPGYNEILSGFADERISSNDKKDNPNTTVLEYLNQQPGFKNRIAVFSSWNVIEAAVNENRSGIYANSANELIVNPRTSSDSLLNDMMRLLPSQFGDGVRQDFLTYFMAKNYLKQNKPRVLFLSFDETDDLAHAGKYADHLEMLHSIDGMLNDLWQTIQTMPQYAGKTTFIITTDHGRGHTPKVRWKDHGTKTADSYQMWFGVAGAGVAPTGEQQGGPVLFQNQLAATIARLLGVTYKAEHPVGEPVSSVFK